MALRGTPKVKPGILTLKCPIDSSHKIPAGLMYQHLITHHGMRDVGIIGISYIPGKGGGDEVNFWYKRDEKICPICKFNGTTRQFRTLNIADEIDSGDSLEYHLINEHGMHILKEDGFYILKEDSYALLQE